LGFDNFVLGTVSVTIAAANAPPTFASPWTPASPQYNISEPEDTPAGSYITTMLATDPNNNLVLYNISSSNPDGLFAINNASGECCFVSIKWKL
jgi:hypothetical protein